MKEKYKFHPKELLEPASMLRLYAGGAFPMADEITGEINWYMPTIRTIIPLDNYNIPRSFKKQIPKLNFQVKYDTDFLSVVKGCTEREKTWISRELIDAYVRLEKIGHVHTVEVWQDEKLVGGLYGISFNGAFFGESMFSRVTQASKFALMSLIQHLNEKGFILLDVQYITEHLKMFGAKEISFDEYTNLLVQANTLNCEF